MLGFGTVITILGLAFLMVVHESGHFFIARAFGMRVTRFSIGFGPTFFKIIPQGGYFWFTTAGERVRIRLFRHNPEKHGPTIYQVGMIPFIAYVQIAGMNPLEDIDPKDKGSYANASVLGRILTIFGGPFANYAFASVFFFLSFFFGGRELPSTTTDFDVIPDLPAAMAHLQNGDRVVEIDGVAVSEWQAMADIIAKHPNQEISIVVERAGQRIPTKVTPASDGGRGRIGIRGHVTTVKVGAAEAAKLAITRPPIVVRDLVVGLTQWISGRAQGELSGPVGLVRDGARAAERGWNVWLNFLAALSAYLGAFNLIPFPALDGARLMFLGYEAATRRRANARIEAQIHAIGLLMMLGLMVYVTVNDLTGGAK
jgi:regulator of sigma E protease